MIKVISILLVFFPLSLQLAAQNPLPKVLKGKIERIENFQSKYVSPRHIDIWLPEGYSDTTVSSSMGGLISWYAVCEYPEIFCGAACLSTHWMGTFTLVNNPVPESFLTYLGENLPNPADHKIYFDCGDKTLDSLYPDIQKKVDRLMTEKGYTASNRVTAYFHGEDHSERSWNKRLNIPLEFLFKK